MKRKMQAFAFPGKCGGLARSGFRSGDPAAWAEKNPSSSRRAVKANPAKPAPICQRNSRRDPAQSGREARLAEERESIDINEFVQVEQKQTERLPGLRVG